MRFCVVGAGLWGCVMAERIATQLREPVLIIDRRPHLGGNCYSALDPATGIECHRYGSHIFHTSLAEVWNYINQFSSFTGYRHKVLARHAGRVYPMPPNLATINAFYHTSLTPGEVETFLARERARDAMPTPANLEEKAISLIGHPLYSAFIRGYTQKQWGCDPRELSAEIITRLPFRTSYNPEYFNDRWQGLPVAGYARLFSQMLNQPGITLRLNCDFSTLRATLPRDCIILYSGAPDSYFQYQFGKLEWRSLRFEWETLPVKDYQGTPVMNEADATVPWTRTHEFKHYYPERTVPFNAPETVICREFSTGWKDNAVPCYPLNNARNNALYQRYADTAASQPNLLLGGRLGAYRYLDMDQTIADALRCFETQLRPRLAGGAA